MMEIRVIRYCDYYINRIKLSKLKFNNRNDAEAQSVYRKR